MVCRNKNEYKLRAIVYMQPFVADLFIYGLNMHHEDLLYPFYTVSGLSIEWQGEFCINQIQYMHVCESQLL